MARGGEFEREQNGVRREIQQIDEFLCREERSAEIERSGCMMLYPLAEIGIGVFMPIVVGCRQLVMDVLRHGKRRKSEQQQNKAERHSASKKSGQASYRSSQSHRGRATYHGHSRLVKQRKHSTNPIASSPRRLLRWLFPCISAIFNKSKYVSPLSGYTIILKIDPQ